MISCNDLEVGVIGASGVLLLYILSLYMYKEFLTSISVDSSHISLSSDLNGTEIKLDKNVKRENELTSVILQ